MNVVCSGARYVSPALGCAVLISTLERRAVDGDDVDAPPVFVVVAHGNVRAVKRDEVSA